jgi:hypothetical protein
MIVDDELRGDVKESLGQYKIASHIESATKQLT